MKAIQFYLTPLERERQAYIVGDVKEASLMSSLAALEAEKEEAEESQYKEAEKAFKRDRKLKEAIAEAIYRIEMAEIPEALKALEEALSCI